MKIQNVYFWKIIRFKIYNEMLFKLGISKKNEKNKNLLIEETNDITDIYNVLMKTYERQKKNRI